MWLKAFTAWIHKELSTTQSMGEVIFLHGENKDLFLSRAFYEDMVWDFILLFISYRNETKGHMHTRQVLYHWAFSLFVLVHTDEEFCFSIVYFVCSMGGHCNFSID